MAQAGAQLDPETISCFLCFDLLKNPVTIFPGHSYCRERVQHHWDVEEGLRVYSCPQCRRTFTLRPVLEKTGLQAAPADHCYAGAVDVACDVCTGIKLKALKSCLVCRASYCDSHLQPHRQSAAFLRHKLVEPIQELQENVCPRHGEVMKLFCRTDEQSVCSLCAADQHKGHYIVMLPAVEMQRELEETKLKIQQMTVSNIDFFLPEPKSREDFLRYSRPITLDVNTLNYNLLLSEGNRKVTQMEVAQCYCDHPERFTYWPQVLSTESLTGRCYWEVEWTGGVDGVDVTVAYRNINRAGESEECRFGKNDKSWSLACFSGSGYKLSCNNTWTVVSDPKSYRVGVYVDHSAGLLSFYSVSVAMKLLQSVQTTFTRPLHAGLSVHSGATAELIKL
ncbi:tripartite motif-containing protein 16-like [Nelusetta ayraudi]|uniref:tripartite motif-containing protein 16-like n=1 Tax=Nelusetta ayraudi TaxID=303726 RepID=UPI003F71955E